MSNYLKLDWNKPVTISLKPKAPEKVKGFEGPELKWFLADGRTLYTPPSFWDAIKTLGIKPGQRFQVEKRRVGQNVEFHATHLSDLQNGQEAARVIAQAPELAEPEGTLQEPGPQNVQPMRKPPQTALAVALKTAISAAAIAEKHAESLGYSCRFSSGDIRAMGISVLIGMQGGRVA